MSRRNKKRKKRKTNLQSAWLHPDRPVCQLLYEFSTDFYAVCLLLFILKFSSGEPNVKQFVFIQYIYHAHFYIFAISTCPEVNIYRFNHFSYREFSKISSDKGHIIMLPHYIDILWYCHNNIFATPFCSLFLPNKVMKMSLSE